MVLPRMGIILILTTHVIKAIITIIMVLQMEDGTQIFPIKTIIFTIIFNMITIVTTTAPPDGTEIKSMMDQWETILS